MAAKGLAVLDLTDEAVRAELALAPADLVGDGYHRTQAIAEAAVRAGFDAIRAPSAALPGRATLVVFASGVPKLTARASRVRQPPPRLADRLGSIRPHAQVPEAVRSNLRATAEAGAGAVRQRRRRRDL